jgi:tRNA-dihydrouridine synthase
VLGTYIVDPRSDVPYPSHFVFKPGRAQYAGYLEEHVQQARESGALVGVSVVSVRLADSIDFLVAAEEAGADFVSLCAHSTMEMFVNTGTSSALCRRENWGRLREWAGAIVGATRAPAIFKLGVHDTPDTLGAVDILIESGVPVIHMNVERVAEDSAGLTMIARLAEKDAVWIAGGGVKNAADAGRVLAAGADAVAIGTAAMKDAGLCRRIQDQIRPAP